ncbi:MAG: GreA/GreB family elongation factor [Candidatus Nasuia deltocephalinicola]
MKNFFTINDIENLNKEFLKIKNLEIPKVIEEIKNARMLGDLSENSEYHYAKKKKNLLERKLKEIENKLSNSKITSNKKNINSKKIKLQNIKNNKITEYFLNNIEDSENDLFKKTLLKKKINDLIKIKKHNKELIFKIVSIE